MGRVGPEGPNVQVRMGTLVDEEGLVAPVGDRELGAELEAVVVDVVDRRGQPGSGGDGSRPRAGASSPRESGRGGRAGTGWLPSGESPRL